MMNREKGCEHDFGGPFDLECAYCGKGYMTYLAETIIRRGQEYTDLKAEAELLVEALERYGEHEGGCPCVFDPKVCSCDLAETLARFRTKYPKEEK